METIYIVQILVFIVFSILMFNLALKPLNKNIISSLNDISNEIDSIKDSKENIKILVNNQKKKTIDIEKNMINKKNESLKKMDLQKKDIIKEMEEIRKNIESNLEERILNYKKNKMIDFKNKVIKLSLEKSLKYASNSNEIKKSYLKYSLNYEYKKH